MSPVLLLPLILALGAAAWLDLRHRTIPNRLVAVVALLGLVALAVSQPSQLSAHLAVGLALLACGLCVWRLGWLGGGDAKLIAALGIWAGPHHLDALLLGTSLAGGLLAVAAYALRRLAHLPLAMHAVLPAEALVRFSPDLSGWFRRGLPYGVAIAAGGAWVAQRLLAT